MNIQKEVFLIIIEHLFAFKKNIMLNIIIVY